MPDDVRTRLDGVCFTACENGRRRKKRGVGEEVSIDPIVLTYSALVIKCCYKKDRGAQNFRVLEYYYVVLLLTATMNQILQTTNKTSHPIPANPHTSNKSTFT